MSINTLVPWYGSGRTLAPEVTAALEAELARVKAALGEACGILQQRHFHSHVCKCEVCAFLARQAAGTEGGR
jgi:hypothetical protein